jgi:transposase
VAKQHEEWSRCLTNEETTAWARRLATIAITRYGMDAAEAGKIAGAVAARARKYSHEPRAQAQRARAREAKRRERLQPRDERWRRDHDDCGMTWKEISARDGVSLYTIRKAVYRLRDRLGLKLRWTSTSENSNPIPSRGGPAERPQPARPSTVCGSANHAPPDILPSSPPSGPAAATYRNLVSLQSSVKRGVPPIEAVMAVVDPLAKRLQDIAQDMNALHEEKTAIHCVLNCVDPTERLQVA